MSGAGGRAGTGGKSGGAGGRDAAVGDGGAGGNTNANGGAGGAEPPDGATDTQAGDSVEAPPPEATGGAEFFVATSGSDSAPGTMAAPFATLERARDAVRLTLAGGAAGATVWLRGGVYERSATLVLDTEDAGKSGGIVAWRGYPGETARLTGGRRLDRAWVEPVSSGSPMWPRIAAAARGKVMQVNLAAHGITDTGALVRRGFGLSGHAALELFIDGTAQTLARWPDVVAGNPKASFATLTAPNGLSFSYTGDEPVRWSKPTEVWLHGLWGWDWADAHLPVAAIDTTAHTITLASGYQYPLVSGQAFYAQNVLEELNVPGEYFVDRSSGVLCFWPPEKASGTDTVVSLLDGPLVRLAAGAGFVSLRDLTLEATRDTLLEIQGSHDVLLSGLVLRNAGTNAVKAQGTHIILQGSEVYGAGDTAISLSGGDRRSLTAAGDVVETTHIHDWARWDWMYRPGIQLGGVGNVIRHNLLHDAPHASILYGGNDHLIELNEIHHVCTSTSDAGAIYAGRDWSERGNVIRHNFLHDISSWLGNVHGVYLDDTLAGIHVEGNVLYRIQGAGLKHGGGRDNVMVNNIIARSGSGLSTDARGSGRKPVFNLIPKLEAVGYQMEPWKSRYPACAAIPDSWEMVSAPGALWLYPQGVIFSRNIGFDNKTWISARDMATAYFAEIKDDIENQDPVFVDEAKLDLTLGPDSPALKIPGYQPIPFASIGLR